MFLYRALQVRLAEYPAVEYRGYVRDLSSGEYLDFNDATFKDFDDLIEPYRALSEDTNHTGIWTLEYVLPDVTATLEVIVHEVNGPSGSPRVVGYTSFAVVDGEPLLSAARSQVLLNTHTGGFENLRVVDANGQGIEGVVIRVYKASDYSINSNRIQGYTSTDARGYWLVPIPVDAGASYVIHTHKALYYGPKITTTTV